jgi:homoserine kinase type II
LDSLDKVGFQLVFCQGLYNPTLNTQLITDIGMAVYTEVSFQEASSLLAELHLGNLLLMEGCAGGIDNTNYFVTTDQAAYVLTLFERLTAEQLPFYLHLMQHLARHGIPVPDPAARADGSILHVVNGKPAAVVNRLRGKSEMAPTEQHCQLVGEMLAKMHLAGQDFSMQQDNVRGLAWWNSTSQAIFPYLDAAQAELLRSELAFQNHIAGLSDYAALPRGPIHADLFRDNVMFEPPSSPENAPALTGFFDFYFAGMDTWVYDIAVCLNDWCINTHTRQADAVRTRHFLQAYQSVRHLTLQEEQLLPAMLRGGALRFWISRLKDWHLPKKAALLKPHDPVHFQDILQHRIFAMQGT